MQPSVLRPFSRRASSLAVSLMRLGAATAVLCAFSSSFTACLSGSQAEDQDIKVLKRIREINDTDRRCFPLRTFARGQRVPVGTAVGFACPDGRMGLLLDRALA